MVKLYDEALLRRLKFWTEKTDIHVYGTEETAKMFALIADGTNDASIKLPIIALKRQGGYKLRNPNSAPTSRNSWAVEYTNDYVVQLNQIPIEIQYQLDIYTRYYDEADAYCRELIFNIINHPTDTIIIPYENTNIPHNYNLTLLNDVADNSNISEIIMKDTFTRLTLGIEIKDAFLWDVPIRASLSMDTEGLWLVPNGREEEKERINV